MIENLNVNAKYIMHCNVLQSVLIKFRPSK